MDFFFHLLINGIFGLALYWGLGRILHIKHYDYGLMIVFILAAITPDLFWVVYASEYWGIFPPVPPYIIPFIQFMHGILGQLFLWMWIAFTLAIVRVTSYENVLTAGVAGVFLHHIIDLSSHMDGQYPFYPYIQQDWSVGWFLDHTGEIFGEISLFGLLLTILFITMFLLVFVSYRQVRIIEHWRKIDLLFLNLLVSVILLNYWMGATVFFLVFGVLIVIYLLIRFYR